MSREFTSDAKATYVFGVPTVTTCDWSGAMTGATFATTGMIVERDCVAPAEFLTVTCAVKVPTAVYWWDAVGMAVFTAAEPSPQFHVYCVRARPAGSLADAAIWTGSPADVVGSNGLNDMSVTTGFPTPWVWMMTWAFFTVKKSPPSWLTRRAMPYVPAVG